MARIPANDPESRPLLRRVVTPIATSPVGYWYLRNAAPRIDRIELFGRQLRSLPVPLVHLHSTGAKSGKPRENTLVYFSDGERVVCMASNYGGTSHPAWYHNVKAHPEVTLRAAGRSGRYRAEEATGEEHERLWATAKRYSKAWERYEHTAGGRRIPMIVFTPLDG